MRIVYNNSKHEGSSLFLFTGGAVKKGIPAKKGTLPLIIAYYTEGTPYEQEAKLLKESLDSFNLEYDIRAIESLGSWQKNTQVKATFIRKMLEEYIGKPLVYIDVDALVKGVPDFFINLKADIGAVRLRNELLSGTLFLGGTERTRKLVDYWIEMNRKHPDRWDQVNLDTAIKENKDIRFIELPQSYTYIKDISKRRGVSGEPVILHTRGAVRFKGQVNNKKGADEEKQNIDFKKAFRN